MILPSRALVPAKFSEGKCALDSRTPRSAWARCFRDAGRHLARSAGLPPRILSRALAPGRAPRRWVILQLGSAMRPSPGAGIGGRRRSGACWKVESPRPSLWRRRGRGAAGRAPTRRRAPPSPPGPGAGRGWGALPGQGLPLSDLTFRGGRAGRGRAEEPAVPKGWSRSGVCLFRWLAISWPEWSHHPLVLRRQEPARRRGLILGSNVLE